MLVNRSANGPEYIIIGAMKAATTSTQRWLEMHPKVGVPQIQEPNFFSDDSVWATGTDWYFSQFSRSGPATLVGESSVSYTDPALAAIAAERINAVLPNVRLIFLVRHPIERMRSEYRHQVQRGRERRSFDRLLRDEPERYGARSRYHRALTPYLARFPSNRIHVARSEDLNHGPAWEGILRFLDLSLIPVPLPQQNVTESKKSFTRPMLWLFERGITNGPKWIPSPVRAVTSRMLTRDDPKYRRLLDSSRCEIPAELETSLWADTAALESALGCAPLWPR